MGLHPDFKTIAFGTQSERLTPHDVFDDLILLDGTVHVRDKRRMDVELHSAHVHPDSSELPVSSVTWQSSTKMTKSKAVINGATERQQRPISRTQKQAETPTSHQTQVGHL